MAMQNPLTNDQLIEQAKALTGTSCYDLSQLTGSLSHRVYKCKGNDGNFYLMKYYHRPDPTSDVNLVNEYNSSLFMWNHGINQIPEPVNIDVNTRISIYRFINGSRLDPKDVGEEQIGQLVDFLSALHDLSKVEDSAEMTPAGESFFSLDQLFAEIDNKIESLKSYDESNPYGIELKCFIESNLMKGLESLKSDASMLYESYDLSDSDLILYEWTTLSPSDFGFHNALLDDDGKLFFLDFEFFGRDDPVKVVSDFILRPEADLNKKLYFAFLRRIIPIYQKEERTFKERLESIFPLIAVKTLLLPLADFEPENFNKRKQKLSDEKINEIMKKQLQKAEDLVGTIQEHQVDLGRWLKTV